MLLIPTFQVFYSDFYIHGIKESVTNSCVTLLIIVTVLVIFKIFFERKETKKLVRIALIFLTVHYVAAFFIYMYG